MGKIRKIYSKEFKLRPVRMYLEEGYSYKAVAKGLGIPDKSMVRRWMVHYEKEGQKELEEKRGKAKGSKKGRPRKEPESLEEEVIRLKQKMSS
jgi:transposase